MRVYSAKQVGKSSHQIKPTCVTDSMYSMLLTRSQNKSTNYHHMQVTSHKHWPETNCTYKVCSKSIRIGIVVVVHWVGCVCHQSWHVCTCLSNSWHKLQVAAFAQLAAVGRGSNTCVYVIAIFPMCESTEQYICIKFCFKIGKTATETYQLLQQA